MLGLSLFVVSYLFFSSLLGVASFLASVTSPKASKKTPYECGFSSVGAVQASFSVHFYALLLIFVVFDLEVVFLLGFALSDSASFALVLLFWVLIYATYYLELSWGSFKWGS